MTRNTADLVADCLHLVDGAWNEFVDRHAGLVWMVISRYDLPAHDRGEAFHATFAAGWTNLAAVRNTDRIHLWLTRIARNEVYRLFRDQRGEIDVTQVQNAVATPERGPEERLRALEVAHEVRAAIAELPQPYRATLENYLATEGKIDRHKLAKELNIEPGSVRKTKARALQMLRDRLIAFTEQGPGAQRTVSP
ncbi:MAG: sigma-70 family RNA polymerase sigma factor [Planctomycetota bacterium]